MKGRLRAGANRRDFFRLAGAAAGASIVLGGAGQLSGADEEAFPDLAKRKAAHAKRGVIPPDKTYRMMELSLHLPPEGKFEIDLEGVVASAKDAGAESLMFYSQDHWGHALYTSDVGVRHPNLKGDFFGNAVALTRKHGMSAVAYYSLQFNNQIVLKHPDWAWVNEKGEPQRMRWFIPCLDSPYRQYALGMIDEIFSRYEVDELFLDIFGIQFLWYHQGGPSPFCFCKHTQEAWNREHPGDPYLEGFKTREGWDRRYRWHQNRSMTGMLDAIIAAARKHRPKTVIALNGGPESFPDEIHKRVGFLYNEPLNSPSGIALGAILLRGWGRPDFQAGVFNMHDYVDLHRGSTLRIRADAMIVQNARVFFVGESPMVSGIEGGRGFMRRWFDLAKEAWRDVREVDCLLEGIEPLSSSAMLYSQATQDELAAQKRPVDFRHSMLGALELLTYSGRPVECIPEFRLTPDLLDRFETLLLPEVEVLSDAQAGLVREWVHRGGTLLASGKCGLWDERRSPRSNFALADVLGVDYASEENKYACNYIESAGHALAKLIGAGTVGLAGPFINVKRTSAEEVMRYRLPVMIEDLSKNKWYNWGPPPPGDQAGGTAVSLHRFGKGKAVYLALSVFRSLGAGTRANWIRQWIPELIRLLVPNPVAELRTEPDSEFVHGTFFFDTTKKSLLIQVVHTLAAVAEGEQPPAPRVKIRINRSKLNVTAARMLWPKAQDLSVAHRDGEAVIEFADFGTYAAVSAFQS